MLFYLLYLFIQQQLSVSQNRIKDTLSWQFVLHDYWTDLTISPPIVHFILESKQQKPRSFFPNSKGCFKELVLKKGRLIDTKVLLRDVFFF